MGYSERSNKTTEQIDALLQMMAEIDLRVKFLMTIIKVKVKTSPVLGADGKESIVEMLAQELFDLKRGEFLAGLIKARDDELATAAAAQTAGTGSADAATVGEGPAGDRADSPLRLVSPEV